MDVFLWRLLYGGARLSDVRADTLILSACEGEDENAESGAATLYLQFINGGPL